MQAPRVPTATTSLLATLVLGASPDAWADIIEVPADEPTIQAAIDVAVSGVDEVIVAPGTYVEAIDFLGKAITVRSSDPLDPDVVAATVIDGGGVAVHVVQCVSGETSASVLDGFTITGGNADGAVFPDDSGGGMYISSLSSPTVANCTFTGNNADNIGGAMFLNLGSSPTITGCTFTGNTAEDGAGMGIFNSSSPAITECTFAGNTATAVAGGMFITANSSPTVTDCILIGNSAGDTGGGMYIGSSPTVTNCSFIGNTADGLNGGGGMFTIGVTTSPVVTNCTFTGNMAPNTNVGAGGMCNFGSSTATIANCILWGNTGLAHDEMIANGSTPTISYSAIGGSGGSGAGWDPALGTDGGGNIDADPLFVDADGPDDVPGTPDDDVRLADFSPCTDAGDNGAVPVDVTTDLDGNPRFVDDAAVADTGAGVAPIVDLGTYERQLDSEAAVIHVPDDQPTIQDAIDVAVSGVDQIVVAPGTYREAIDFMGKAITLRSTDPLDPAVVAATIIDGAGSFHVVQCVSGEGPDTVLDGFTVTGGTANGSSPDDRGGGMLNVGSSPTVTNCTFSGNTATSGGGMYNDGSNPTVMGCTFSGNEADSGGGMSNWFGSSPVVAECTFVGNAAESGGGGMLNNAGFSSLVTVTGCTFTGNSAEFGGGMENINAGDTRVTDCTFSGNTAIAVGGGMFNTSNGAPYPTVTNCTFIGNGAVGTGGDGEGGGMYNSGDPVVTNCVFIGNFANGLNGGGGMFNIGVGDSPVVTNCTFAANLAPNTNIGAGGMCNFGLSTATITNCVLWGNTGLAHDEIIANNSSPTISFSNIRGSGGSAEWGPFLGVDGGGNIDVEPRFADADGLDDVAGNADDDLRLFITSPCIDAGDNGAVPAGVTEDLDGNPRILNGTVEMGAYEFTPALAGVDGPRLWDSAAGGPFALDGNWIPADAPDAGDVAVFDLGAAYTVTGTSVSSTDRAVVIDGDVTLDLGGFTYALLGPAEGGLIGPYTGGNARLTVTNGTLAAGTIRVNDEGGGALVLDATATADVGQRLFLDDGMLAGSGAVTGLLDNGGLVRPGDPDVAFDFAALAVESFTQTGSLEIEIGGTTPATEHDVLSVTDTATLGGALVARFDFVPTAGQPFAVLDAASIVGQFDVLYVTGLPEGQLVTIQYEAAAGDGGVNLVPIAFDDGIGFDEIDPSTIDAGATAVVAADFNGDSFPDLAVTLPVAGGVVLLLNDGGAGTFTQQPVIPTGANPADLVAAPLDGNASIDLAVVDAADDNVTVLLNDGSGTLTPQTPFPAGNPCTGPPTPCRVPVAITAAALDDGPSLDLAVVSQVDGSLSVFTNDGNGAFTLEQTLFLGGGMTDVAAGDFTGNGANDLIVTQETTGTVQLALNVGAAAGAGVDFVAGDIMVTGSRPTLVCPEDIDENKSFGPGATLDAVVVDAEGTVSFLLNTGDGLGPATSIPVGAAASSLSVIDMDGDGDRDLAVVVEDEMSGSVVRILRNDLESGQLAFSQNEDLAQGENPALVVSTDLDQDGEPDLITINAPPPGGAGAGPACQDGCVQPLLNSAVGCVGDIDGSGVVDVTDLVELVLNWGPCEGCASDIDGDGVVGVADLVELILAWGSCPSS